MSKITQPFGASPTLVQIAGCHSDYDPHALPVALAQRIIGDFVKPVEAIEKVALRSALGRVLAESMVSPIDVPAYDNSAMDGFALRSADLGDSDVTLQVIGTAWAGRSFDGQVAAGQCVRIMTGAIMPAQCDAVVAQEFVTTEVGNAVCVPAHAVVAGENRRLCGEDLETGSIALAKGRLLHPADLGLLASLGIAEVPVQRRLRVAFFSTGDELRSVGQTLDAGCVYDSNRYTLYGMLVRLGCDVIDMGVVKDDRDSLEAALRTACENADAIITSGGVSVGAADYTREIMGKLGDVDFWRIGMRPGRPMAFGRINSNGHCAYLFGLPGNPVAVMVTFYFLARQGLLQMMGTDASPLPLLQAISRGPIRKKIGRTEYQRGILAADAQGRPTVSVTGAQGSGILRSMVEANCMIVLHDAQGPVATGDLVDILLFDGLT